MLISKKLNTIIRILLANKFNKEPELNLSKLAKEAQITSAMTKRIVLGLENSGYIKIRNVIKILRPIRLMKAWGYTYSIRELKHLDFVLAERPQYAMSKIANWARKTKKTYAFTLFSATEYISPYVAPSNTYLYINENDIIAWKKFFRKEKMLPAEKDGNIVCLLVDDDYFKGILTVRNTNIVSLPQLYADLISFGGRAEESTQELMKVIDGSLKNV